MDTKWVTFRLQDGPRRNDRWHELLQLVIELDREAWDEPTSFFLIRTDLPTADVAMHLAHAISKHEDVLLVGSTTDREVYVVGEIRAEKSLIDRLGSDLRRLA